MAKIPTVDKEKCIGCGSCVALCPKVFRINDKGKSEVFDPKGDSEKNMQSAIDVCPTGAISWKK